MTPGRRRTLIGAYATLTWFTVLAGQFWRNLLGWWGFAAVALLIIAGAVALVIAVRPAWRWRRVPKSIVVFLLIATLSIAWSYYPAASVLGVAITLVTTFTAVALTLCLGWTRLVRALGGAIKWVLALSLAFELWVAIFVQGPVAPNFTEYADDVPSAFYWSRGLLFQGGPIEGIVGSRNLLWARRVGPHGRRRVYWTAAGVLVAYVALLAALWNPLLELFGKSDDLTGRLDICEMWSSPSTPASSSTKAPKSVRRTIFPVTREPIG